MNLNQLLYFHAVARTGNYSRAAEELGISEPVIHRAVKSLEKTCGVRLLERIGRGIRLTGPGSAIYENASQIASLATLTEQTLVERRGLISGKISIGAVTTVVSYILPDILGKWMAEHPGVDILLIQERTEELQKLLLEGRMDVLFASRIRSAPGLRSQMIFSDKLLVVSAPSHPAAQRSLIRLSELNEQRLILSSKGSSIRDELQEIEYQYGAQFRAAVEVTRDYPIKQLCMAGVGVAILPMSVVREELANNQLRSLNVEGFPRNRPYFVVYRVDKALTTEMKSLLSAVQLWLRQRDESWEMGNSALPNALSPTAGGAAPARDRQKPN